MKIGVTAIICSILYSLLLSFVYFSKQRIENSENKIYSILIRITLIGLFLELCCCFLILLKDLNTFFNIFNLVFNRAFLIYLVSWEYIFTVYMFLISFSKKDSFYKTLRSKKMKNLAKILYLFLVLCALILPLYYYNDGIYVYSYGKAANLTYIVGGIGLLCDIFCLIKNAKKLLNKKFIPLYILIFLMIVLFIIRKINPGLIIINSTFSFITAIMYFTIENPDKKVFDELYRNKELVEQTYEDKSNFLFELTQEVRNPLNNITNLCNNISNSNDLEEIKKDIKVINNSIRQLDFIVNDVLNVSTLNVQKVKFVNNRYSLQSLYDDLVTRIKINVSDNVEFRTNIPNNVPILYGDSIKLKQVLFSLIMNSVKKTNNGFIEFSVNTIERYDVCRVIFSIKDSGSGMSIDKINEILSVTGEFDQTDIDNLEKTEFNIKLCQKIIKMLGGNLLIKSAFGKGTEVILSIDQKKYIKENDKDILTIYENNLYSVKKTLIVCQDKNLTNILKKKIKEKNISCSVVLYGIDAVDKIKSGKKYDYIIIQDDMKEMSGYTTLKELKNIDKFNTPVIVMLDNNKVNIKEQYIKDGFKDYILLDNFTEELNRILEKY